MGEIRDALFERIEDERRREAALLPAVAHPCDNGCGQLTMHPENEYGEFICHNCEQNAAEAAYERQCQDFHDGGATQFNSLRDQQIEARKLK